MVDTRDPNATCPYYGGKPCKKVCMTCAMYRQFTRDTESGVREPFYECVHYMQVAATMEGNVILKQIHDRLGGNQQAIESFRNEMVKSNAVGHRLLASHGSNGTYQAMHRSNGTYQAIPVGDGTFIAGPLLDVD